MIPGDKWKSLSLTDRIFVNGEVDYMLKRGLPKFDFILVWLISVNLALVFIPHTAIGPILSIGAGSAFAMIFWEGKRSIQSVVH